MKLITQVFALNVAALIFSSIASADNAVGTWGMDCGPADVLKIQTQKNEVLVYLHNPTVGWKAWKGIGSHTDVFLKSYQAVVQQAMAQGKKITVRFPAGHNCAATDYSSKPYMVNLSLDV